MNNNCVPPCTELTMMQKDIEQIKSDVKRLVEYQEKQEKMYAKKWVENVLIGFIGMLVMSALYIIWDGVGLPR